MSPHPGSAVKSKRSIHFLIYISIICHAAAVLSAIWILSVPLDQAMQHTRGPMTTSAPFGNIIAKAPGQINSLIQGAILVIAISGGVLWQVHRRLRFFENSLQDTIHHLREGDLNARLGVINSFERIASDFDRLTAHRQQEAYRLTRITHLLTAVSACRHTMLSNLDTHHLHQQITDILTETGSYHMAWIGRHAAPSTEITVSGWSGGEPVDAAPDFWMHTECSPIRRAIQNRHPAFLHDVMNDPRAASWRDDAAIRQYAAVAVLPIIHDPQAQEVTGVLTVYAQTSLDFDIDEIRLLMELADDIGSQEKKVAARP